MSPLRFEQIVSQMVVEQPVAVDTPSIPSTPTTMGKRTKQHVTSASVSLDSVINETVYEYRGKGTKSAGQKRSKGGTIRPVQHSRVGTDIPVIQDSNSAAAVRTLNPNSIERTFTFEEGKIGSNRKGKTQHDLRAEWFEKQDQYLSVLLEHEAPPYCNYLCTCNRGEIALYACMNCHGTTSHCIQCILGQHQRMPFHRVKKWNRFFLEDVSLSTLGLVTYFGHGGSACPISAPHFPLTVLHIDGFHFISASFCQCSSAKTNDLQLFESKLFAASVSIPKSAFTFELLDHFRLNNFEAKTSPYIYIQSLYRLTDNDGSRDVPDRVREFRRVAHQWNHLISRKHAGRYGLNALSQSLIIQCPACPRPGINLPDNWYEETPPEKRWLARRYTLFDANFHLVLARKNRRDLGSKPLWSGPGFFVHEAIYHNYLTKAGQRQQEKSDCSNHRAALLTTQSRNTRLEITGIAGGVCRHECAIPDAFVNLQKGERYVNSDFAISNILQDVGKHQEVVLSYDIACQYSRHFNARLAACPPFLTPPTHISLLFLIPKFHLPAHKELCRYLFSFNYTKKVGRTDGEAIERFWAAHNHLSGSTMRMTPALRLDTLNYHFNDWNWKKIRKMGFTLAQRLRTAVDMVSQHALQYAELKESSGPSKILEWIAMEERFQPQHGNPSIYQAAADKAPTRNQVLLRLTQLHSPARARDMDNAASSGNTLSAETLGHADLSPSNPTLAFWINDGLEIEEAQARLDAHAKSLGLNATERERIGLNHRRTTLAERISTWKSQSPSTAYADDEDEENLHPEKISLLLPSTTALKEQGTDAQTIEKQLREGQAFDCLRALRKSLAEKIALQRGQKQDDVGQIARNRSYTAISRLDDEIDLISERYRANCNALLALMAEGEKINVRLQELKDDDVSAIDVFNFSQKTGRGSIANISWIWSQMPMGGDDDDNKWLEEVLRVQFLEAKASYDRWTEECELVKAEMSYAKATFEYTSKRWEERSTCAQSDGEIAHAYYMKNVYTVMAEQIDERSREFS